MEIDFKGIVARSGSKWEAFEELSCQLAAKEIAGASRFVRIHGAGGDGGMEGYVDLTDRGRVGVQAKYLFGIDPLLKQTSKSLQTALQIHPTLSRYIVCFPFDLTGPTGRRGRSGTEKFNDWRAEKILEAAQAGRVLEIEAWPASYLKSLLLELDPKGGMRSYFFDATILSPDWFTAHLATVREIAGPRYTKELNIQTGVARWFSALARTDDWLENLQGRVNKTAKNLRRLSDRAAQESKDPAVPNWPDTAKELAISAIGTCTESLECCRNLYQSTDPTDYEACLVSLESALVSCSELEERLISNFDERHGPGRADSPGFRQFMAEYQVSFPAANLDATRELIDQLHELNEWTASAQVALAYASAFVLSGDWGVGKTHTICDVADSRFAKEQLSCVVFGHQFDGDPDPWTRFAEVLGLSGKLGKEGVLDALEAAAEATGRILLILVDAINETRPREFWRRRIAPMISAVRCRRNLRICFSCRTPFLFQCLPDKHSLQILEHPGFKGAEHIACAAFFEHYGLVAPVAPILQPELSNPLYLRLVCETLVSLGLDRMPSGWSSAGQVITSFLAEKEKEFAIEKGVRPAGRIVTSSLLAIAREIGEAGVSSISWSAANNAVVSVRPEASQLGVIDWLIGANLLIEEGPLADASFGSEGMVRPSFERIGDYLIGSEILSKYSDLYAFKTAVVDRGALRDLLGDSNSAKRNFGVVSALSVLMPEKWPETELPDLVTSPETYEPLLEAMITSVPWRDPRSLTARTGRILSQALSMEGVSQKAMDAIISVSWNPSVIDALWLDEFIRQTRLAQRDAYWCWYLHDSFERLGPVARLINAAFEMRLEGVDPEIAERWSTALLWFTAAADRRVKDKATRAAITVILENCHIIPSLIKRLCTVDDDEVRERALLVCYGVLLLTRDRPVIEELASTLFAEFKKAPLRFDNAIVRDAIRSIAELAREEGVWRNDRSVEFAATDIASEWPLQLPTKEQIDNWSKDIRFKPDEFYSDFYKYSMDCPRPWQYAVSKEDMGYWIAQHVAVNLGYCESACSNYDSLMLADHGGGRAKPNWAERIAKKYLWIALYRLASRLHDHIERKAESWEPDPIRTPLILLEERKLDPTLPAIKFVNSEAPECWWVRGSIGLDENRTLSDRDWVKSKRDLPDIKQFVSLFEQEGRSLRLLASYPSWGRRPENVQPKDGYRNAWMHIQSFLIPIEDQERAFQFLDGRSLFGKWLPEPPSWSYGFAGEYPWATPFNTEPDEWHGSGRRSEEMDFDCHPTWSQIAAEWEYDASLRENLYFMVPCKMFFSSGRLRWNGSDGFVREDNRLVFRDPGILEVGPKSLVTDGEDLSERLRGLKLGLIWTVLGEKWILGRMDANETSRWTFSQVAMLDKKDQLVVGRRSYHEV